MGRKLDALSARGFSVSIMAAMVPIMAGWSTVSTLAIAMIAYIIGA